MGTETCGDAPGKTVFENEILQKIEMDAQAKKDHENHDERRQ
jgi:hypothetical protein